MSKQPALKAVADDIETYLAGEWDEAEEDETIFDSLVYGLAQFFKPVVVCTCGGGVTVDVVGGQYQNLYVGTCVSCGHKWHLEDITAEGE